MASLFLDGEAWQRCRGTEEEEGGVSGGVGRRGRWRGGRVGCGSAPPQPHCRPLLGQEDYQSAPCCTLSGVHFHRDGNDFHSPPSASTVTHTHTHIRARTAASLLAIHPSTVWAARARVFSHYIIMSQGKAVWTGDKLDQVLRRRERVFISLCGRLARVAPLLRVYRVFFTLLLVFSWQLR